MTQTGDFTANATTNLSPVVYHGSPRSFNDFDVEIARQFQNPVHGNTSDAIYFTDKPYKANAYTRSGKGLGQIRTARLDIRNPYRTSDIREMDHLGTQQGVDELKAQGYDGIIFDPNPKDMDVLGREYVVFDKSQIYPAWAQTNAEPKASEILSSNVSNISSTSSGKPTDPRLPSNPIDDTATPEKQAEELVALAEKHFPNFSQTMQKIGEKFGVSARYRIKSADDMVEKILRERNIARGLKVANLTDPIGGEIGYDHPEQIEQIVKSIIDETGAHPINIQDRMFSPKASGWRALSIDFQKPDGTMFEIQLLPKEIAKVAADEHQFYKTWRGTSDQYKVDNASSYKQMLDHYHSLYEEGFDKYIKRVYPELADSPPEALAAARAAWDQFMARLPETRVNSSFSSSTSTDPTLQGPSPSSTIDKPSSPNTKILPSADSNTESVVEGDASAGSKTSSTDVKPSSGSIAEAAYGSPISKPAGDLTRVVYHGSDTNFTKFDREAAAQARSARSRNDLRYSNESDAVYFSDDPNLASAYTKPNGQFIEPTREGHVRMARLRLENPYTTKDPQEVIDVLSKQEVIDSLKAKGYDGIIFDPGDGGPREYAVFSENQIYSPWANNSLEGPYNPSALPDIPGIPSADSAAAATGEDVLSGYGRTVGWKLHLNVGRITGEDGALEAVGTTENAQKVMSVLDELKSRGLINKYKFAYAREFGPGKDFTVYVGSKDQADEVSKILQDRVGDNLLNPGSSTLETDRVFTAKIWGRFDVGSNEAKNVPGHPDFEYYGDNGMPNLKDAGGDDLKARAAALEKEFGTTFTGSDRSWLDNLTSSSSTTKDTSEYLPKAETVPPEKTVATETPIELGDKPILSRTAGESSSDFLMRTLKSALKNADNTVRIKTGDLTLEYTYDPNNNSFMEGVKVISGDDPVTMQSFASEASKYDVVHNPVGGTAELIDTTLPKNPNIGKTVSLKSPGDGVFGEGGKTTTFKFKNGGLSEKPVTYSDSKDVGQFSNEIFNEDTAKGAIPDITGSEGTLRSKTGASFQEVSSSYEPPEPRPPDPNLGKKVTIKLPGEGHLGGDGKLSTLEYTDKGFKQVSSVYEPPPGTDTYLSPEEKSLLRKQLKDLYRQQGILEKQDGRVPTKNALDSVKEQIAQKEKELGIDRQSSVETVPEEPQSTDTAYKFKSVTTSSNDPAGGDNLGYDKGKTYARDVSGANLADGSKLSYTNADGTVTNLEVVNGEFVTPEAEPPIKEGTKLSFKNRDGKITTIEYKDGRFQQTGTRYEPYKPPAEKLPNIEDGTRVTLRYPGTGPQAEGSKTTTLEYKTRQGFQKVETTYDRPKSPEPDPDIGKRVTLKYPGSGPNGDSGKVATIEFQEGKGFQQVGSRYEPPPGTDTYISPEEKSLQWKRLNDLQRQRDSLDYQTDNGPTTNAKAKLDKQIAETKQKLGIKTELSEEPIVESRSTVPFSLSSSTSPTSTTNDFIIDQETSPGVTVNAGADTGGNQGEGKFSYVDSEGKKTELEYQDGRYFKVEQPYEVPEGTRVRLTLPGSDRFGSGGPTSTYEYKSGEGFNRVGQQYERPEIKPGVPLAREPNIQAADEPASYQNLLDEKQQTLRNLQDKQTRLRRLYNQGEVSKESVDRNAKQIESVKQDIANLEQELGVDAAGPAIVPEAPAVAPSGAATVPAPAGAQTAAAADNTVQDAKVLSRDPAEAGYSFLKRALADAVNGDGKVLIQTGGVTVEYTQDPSNKTFMDGVKVVAGEDPVALQKFQQAASQYDVNQGLQELGYEPTAQPAAEAELAVATTGPESVKVSTASVSGPSAEGSPSRAEPVPEPENGALPSDSKTGKSVGTTEVNVNTSAVPTAEPAPPSEPAPVNGKAPSVNGSESTGSPAPESKAPGASESVRGGPKVSEAPPEKTPTEPKGSAPESRPPEKTGTKGGTSSPEKAPPEERTSGSGGAGEKPSAPEESPKRPPKNPAGESSQPREKAPPKEKPLSSSDRTKLENQLDGLKNKKASLEKGLGVGKGGDTASIDSQIEEIQNKLGKGTSSKSPTGPKTGSASEGEPLASEDSNLLGHAGAVAGGALAALTVGEGIKNLVDGKTAQGTTAVVGTAGVLAGAEAASRFLDVSNPVVIAGITAVGEASNEVPKIGGQFINGHPVEALQTMSKSNLLGLSINPLAAGTNTVDAISALSRGDLSDFGKNVAYLTDVPQLYGIAKDVVVGTYDAVKPLFSGGHTLMRNGVYSPNGTLIGIKTADGVQFTKDNKGKSIYDSKDKQGMPDDKGQFVFVGKDSKGNLLYADRYGRVSVVDIAAKDIKQDRVTSEYVSESNANYGKTTLYKPTGKFTADGREIYQEVKSTQYGDYSSNIKNGKTYVLDNKGDLQGASTAGNKILGTTTVETSKGKKVKATYIEGADNKVRLVDGNGTVYSTSGTLKVSYTAQNGPEKGKKIDGTLLEVKTGKNKGKYEIIPEGGNPAKPYFTGTESQIKSFLSKRQGSSDYTSVPPGSKQVGTVKGTDGKTYSIYKAPNGTEYRTNKSGTQIYQNLTKSPLKPGQNISSTRAGSRSDRLTGPGEAPLKSVPPGSIKDGTVTLNGKKYQKYKAPDGTVYRTDASGKTIYQNLTKNPIKPNQNSKNSNERASRSDIVAGPGENSIYPKSGPKGSSLKGTVKGKDGNIYPVYQAPDGTKYRTDKSGKTIYQTTKPKNPSSVSGTSTTKKPLIWNPGAGNKKTGANTLTSANSGPKNGDTAGFTMTYTKTRLVNQGAPTVIKNQLASAHGIDIKGDKGARLYTYSDGSQAVWSGNQKTRYRWVIPPPTDKTIAYQATEKIDAKYQNGRWVQTNGQPLSVEGQARAQSIWDQEHPKVRPKSGSSTGGGRTNDSKTYGNTSGYQTSTTYRPSKTTGTPQKQPPAGPKYTLASDGKPPEGWKTHGAGELSGQKKGQTVTIGGQKRGNVTVDTFKDGTVVYKNSKGAIIGYGADKPLKVASEPGKKPTQGPKTGSVAGTGQKTNPVIPGEGIDGRRFKPGTQGAPAAYTGGAAPSFDPAKTFSFVDKKGRNVTITTTASGAEVEQVAGQKAYTVKKAPKPPGDASLGGPPPAQPQDSALAQAVQQDSSGDKTPGYRTNSGWTGSNDAASDKKAGLDPSQVLEERPGSGGKTIYRMADGTYESYDPATGKTTSAGTWNNSSYKAASSTSPTEQTSDSYNDSGTTTESGGGTPYNPQNSGNPGPAQTKSTTDPTTPPPTVADPTSTPGAGSQSFEPEPVIADPACFPAGTMILTPQGQIDISKLKIGDLVLSWNFKLRQLVKAKITEVFKHSQRPTIIIRTAGGSVTTTREHRFYNGREWLTPARLEAGKSSIQDKEGHLQEVISINNASTEDVYNLHVDHPDHNYFADNLLAHNRKIDP